MSVRTDPVEVEVKLHAPASFEVPPLDGIIDGASVGAATVRTLDTTYLDAIDLRLARAGLSLRHRTGEADGPGVWTLKLPDLRNGRGNGMHRPELEVDGGPGAPPEVLLDRVRPWLRTASLRPVAHLRTVRRATQIVAGTGVVAEVSDDAVAVLNGTRVVSRFRELEVELGPAAIDPDGVLDAFVGRLRDAGAGPPDPTSKLARAAGPRALQPADLAPVMLGESPSAADVLCAGVADATLRIIEHDAVIRADDDIEGVHQARVGTRRLRSDLKTFTPILDRNWVESLRDELGWLADLLGAVRDLDVLGVRLRRAVTKLPERDRTAAEPLVVRLSEQRAGAQQALVVALGTDRYAVLLDRLVDAVHNPRTTAAADEPAAGCVPQLAGRAFGKVKKAVRKLGKSPTDDELHGVRILAKRARYAAEVAEPVAGAGAPARAFARAVARLQDVLGDHHDAAVAERWLRAAAVDAPAATAVAAGLLVAAQHDEARKLDRRWRPAWRAVDRGKLTEWMTA